MREVPGYKGYLCAKSGKIYSKKSGELRLLKQWVNKKRYVTVTMVSDLKIKSKIYVHIVVAKTWITNPDDHPTVDHLDSNPENNHVSNLEWCSYKEQSIRSAKNRKIKGRKVYQTNMDGTLIKEFSSIKEAANETGVSRSTISAACIGNMKLSTRTGGGFGWFYKEYYTGQKIDTNKIRKKKVLQYTLGGEFVEEFEGLKDAAKSVGCSSQNIGDVCRGKTETAFGFMWRNKDEKESEPEEDPYEDWVELEGIPGYKISDQGDVYSIRSKRLLKPWKDGDRRMVQLTGRKKYFVYRLVALAYLPNPHNHPIVNHIDGNSLNDCVSNLEWCTKSHDVHHAYEMGLNKQVRAVVKKSEDREIVETFRSVSEAVRKCDIAMSTIQYALKRGRVCHGFIWEYAE